MKCAGVSIRASASLTVAVLTAASDRTELQHVPDRQVEQLSHG